MPSEKYTPLVCWKKCNKGLFSMVTSHRRFYHSAFIGKHVYFSCISVLPKTFDCSSYHITCSPLTFSPWVVEAKRKKEVSTQSQVASATRNTHRSQVSLIPKFPVQTHCSSSPVHALQLGYLESLTASVPSGADFSVTMPCLYPNPT